MELSKTDKAFVEDAAKRGLTGWYNFSEERKETCWMCQAKFTTRLHLNRYCSPACRNKDMAAL